MNISTALVSATETLQRSGISESRREAASLLSFVLKRELVFIVAHPEYELSAEEQALFGAVVGRREKREPFQYIVGVQEFFALRFEVTPDVLIPRPETEILVEAAIENLLGIAQPTFCEVGIGSGCISISILKNVPNARAVSVDVSKAAIAVAEKNAAANHVSDRLQIINTDVFEGVAGKFDLIVSNPPYIPAYQMADLQPEVRQFEPHLALDGGPDGLSIVRRIIDGSTRLLAPNGVVLMEIGFGQAEDVKALFDSNLWSEPEYLADLQNISRVVVSRRLRPPSDERGN